ncbi:MAG: HD domain-containing protein [Waddliaceae bacterium]
MQIYPVKEESKMDDSLLNLRKLRQEDEKKILHPKAALSNDHNRYFGAENDHRLPYKRDVDRIVHSRAYARYIDKTQVVYLVQNDHLTHRSLHVQLVSNFARGIAEILRLNLDLVEAIALGHDVGHSPFGHEGEEYLSELSQEFNAGYFAHSLQSCRLLFDIESLNLGLMVYDGFLCHDGGLKSRKIVPQFGKTWDMHFEECANKKQNLEFELNPATLEGCLVRICDTISYVGKDIEDAITLGIITRDQIPETCLGTTNRSILNVLAKDLIKESEGRDYISLSEEKFLALKELRKFNFNSIYTHSTLKEQSEKVKRGFRILFETLLNEFRSQGERSFLYREYLKNKRPAYFENTSDAQMVIDYLSGMTDSYFIRTLERLIVPSQLSLSV